MDKSSFTVDSPGKPLKLKKGRWAFSPNPIPSHKELDPETANQLASSWRAIGKFEGLISALEPIQQPVRNVLLFQEAAGSLRLERMDFQTREHFHSLIGFIEESGGAQIDDISLFINAHNAGLEYLRKDLPPSIDLILKLQSTIFQKDLETHGQIGIRGNASANLGAINLISDIFQYIPPPEPHLKMALYSLDKHFRKPEKLPNLIDFALVFYQLIAIQPFIRGNIATTCLLNNILISNMLTTPSPSAPISPFIRAEMTGFAEAFIQVVKSGGWSEWIRFYLKGMTRQFDKARLTAERVLNLRNEYLKRLEKERVSAALAQLVDSLFMNPVLTVNQASRLARVTFRAAQFNVDKLAGLEIIRETTGRKRNRIYMAPEILNIYENDQP